MRILLDSNILLRLAEPRHTQRRVSLDATDQLERSGHQAVIVPQMLYEFWSVATRPAANNGLGMTPAAAHAETVEIRRLFALLPDDHGILPIWEQLVSSLGVKGKASHDARIVAAMTRHSIVHLLTWNTSDFSRYSMVTAISPPDLVAGVVSI